MGFRFEVFQFCKNSEGETIRNCWRSSRTFEGAMKEAAFSKKDRDYAKRKGIDLKPHFILDTLTGEVVTIE